jgi:hypothetical protein
VWHSCVFPLLNSPYISVIDPVSMPPAGKGVCVRRHAKTGKGVRALEALAEKPLPLQRCVRKPSKTGKGEKMHATPYVTRDVTRFPFTSTALKYCPSCTGFMYCVHVLGSCTGFMYWVHVRSTVFMY